MSLKVRCQSALKLVLHIKAILLLTLLAVLLAKHVYLPACEANRQAQTRERELRAEVNDLRRRLSRLEAQRDALEAGSPEAVEEAIRREMGWGAPGEVLLDTETMTSSPNL